MTDLTEQWQKGELPDGFYWIEFQDGEILPTTFSSMHGFIYCDSLCDDENIKQILEEMPSYEEWQASEKYNKHLEEKIKIYERKDKQATETSIAYNELEEENTKLKELLKECHDTIYETAFKLRKVSEIDKCNEIRKKIREVLGAEYGFKTPKYYVRNRAKDLGEE